MLKAVAPKTALAMVAAGMILSSGVNTTRAQAFTCPSPAVCVFQGLNFTGYVATYPTFGASGGWLNLRNPGGLKVPWGSFNDNSGSRVQFWNKTLGATWCFPAHTRLSGSGGPNGHTSAGWMQIDYGVPNC
jgi:hypothetical protein